METFTSVAVLLIVVLIVCELRVGHRAAQADPTLRPSSLHPVLALGGGAGGYAFGVYRARTTFVAAVAAHRGLILRDSIESSVATAATDAADA